MHLQGLLEQRFATIHHSSTYSHVHNNNCRLIKTRSSEDKKNYIFAEGLDNLNLCSSLAISAENTLYSFQAKIKHFLLYCEHSASAGSSARRSLANSATIMRLVKVWVFVAQNRHLFSGPMHFPEQTLYFMCLSA